MMEWIYLSPHLDDVILSCGGLIWEQTQAGELVSIWTICTADPAHAPLSTFAESLHTRWGLGPEASQKRRLEDIAACSLIGASVYHFGIPDCIYRMDRHASAYLYASDQAIMGEVHASEAGLVVDLSAEIARMLPQDARIVCPLSVGGHVDHRLTRTAAERLEHPLWYYSDYPYILRYSEKIQNLLPTGWEPALYQVTLAGLDAWQRAIAEYRSQISTFWNDNASMKNAIHSYLESSGGAILWHPPNA